MYDVEGVMFISGTTLIEHTLYSLIEQSAMLCVILCRDGSNGLQLRYASLEKLWLDDNKLTDLSTFAILAGLRRSVHIVLKMCHFTLCLG